MKGTVGMRKIIIMLKCGCACAMQPGVAEIAYTFAGISGQKYYTESIEVC